MSTAHLEWPADFLRVTISHRGQTRQSARVIIIIITQLQATMRCWPDIGLRSGRLLRVSYVSKVAYSVSQPGSTYKFLIKYAKYLCEINWPYRVQHIVST